MNLRDRMREGMDFSNTTMLEIGPLHRPFVLKTEGDVIYVDHAETETIRRKYKWGIQLFTVTRTYSNKINGVRMWLHSARC
jgi:hypothetical protein